MKIVLLVLLGFAITARFAVATAGEFSDAAAKETFTFADSTSKDFVQRSASHSTARSMFLIAPALMEHRQYHIPSFYDDEKAMRNYQQAWESYLQFPHAHGVAAPTFNPLKIEISAK